MKTDNLSAIQNKFLKMTFKNKLLEIVSYVTNIVCKKKTLEIPNGYKLVHQDTFEKIDYDNFWKKPDENGEFITNNLRVYWNGIDGLKVKDNVLEISMDYKPKSWTIKNLGKWQRDELGYSEVEGNPVPQVLNPHNQNAIKETHQNDTLEIPYVCGKLESKVGFKYGIFKVEAILPTGTGLWPSFWTYALESWPPEIDIFEGYTREDKIEPNVHYGNNHQNHKNYGSTAIAVSHKYDEWHEYACWWEKDFIKIYYDGRLVYEVTDKNVLKWFDVTNQRIIMNCNKELWEPGELDLHPVKKPYKLRNFRIYQK